MRVPASILPFLLIFFACVLPACSQQSVPQQTSSTLRGTVRDGQGQAVSSAAVRVESNDKARVLEANTDAQGNYSFSSLPGGTYSVRAGKSGYADAVIADVFLPAEGAKTVDLILEAAGGVAFEAPAAASSAASSSTASSASSSASSSSDTSASGAPTFFDQPTFTISGVTDTASPGGHGSDVVVRTHEALARDTASLGKPAVTANPGASAALEQSLRERVEREPQSFEANRKLGECLLAEAKAGEAIAYLGRAAELNPDDFENAYDLALANYDTEHYDGARAQARALLLHHDTAALHHLLADIEERLADFLGAVREYQRAAAFDPSEPYLFDWGSELLLHHAPEPALEVFREGNRAFPQSRRMLLGLGVASFEGGDVDGAVKRFSAASDLAPGDAAPYLFLGKIELAQDGASDEILAMLRRFVTVHPESAAANYYYALALWKRSKLAYEGDGSTTDAATVETLLHNALRIDQNFAAAYLQLGIVHSERRDLEKAIQDFQQAIQSVSSGGSAGFPSTAEEAHYRLAQAYRRTGQLAKAKAEFQVHDQMKKESTQKAERQRRDLGQFLYTLRNQGPSR
jgi:tetratricopeptide (TPR) repeat protein